jgi:hypothetical protein
MGDVFWRGVSQQVARSIAQLKMEDACNLGNVIEFFCWNLNLVAMIELTKGPTP